MADRMELEVVGMNYRVTPGTLMKIKRETPLRCVLEREPANVHDENAIKVVITQRPWAHEGEGLHIGYISRQVATVLAPKMDAGKFPFTDVWVTDVDPDKGIGDLLLKKPLRQRK
jgi:hypothetical protein